MADKLDKVNDLIDRNKATIFKIKRYFKDDEGTHQKVVGTCFAIKSDMLATCYHQPGDANEHWGFAENCNQQRFEYDVIGESTEAGYPPDNKGMLHYLLPGDIAKKIDLSDKSSGEFCDFAFLKLQTSTCASVGDPLDQHPSKLKQDDEIVILHYGLGSSTLLYTVCTIYGFNDNTIEYRYKSGTPPTKHGLTGAAGAPVFLLRTGELIGMHFCGNKFSSYAISLKALKGLFMEFGRGQNQQLSRQREELKSKEDELKHREDMVKQRESDMSRERNEIRERENDVSREREKLRNEREEDWQRKERERNEKEREKQDEREKKEREKEERERNERDERNERKDREDREKEREKERERDDKRRSGQIDLQALTPITQRRVLMAISPMSPTGTRRPQSQFGSPGWNQQYGNAGGSQYPGNAGGSQFGNGGGGQFGNGGSQYPGNGGGQFGNGGGQFGNAGNQWGSTGGGQLGNAGPSQFGSGAGPSQFGSGTGPSQFGSGTGPNQFGSGGGQFGNPGNQWGSSGQNQNRALIPSTTWSGGSSGFDSPQQGAIVQYSPNASSMLSSSPLHLTPTTFVEHVPSYNTGRTVIVPQATLQPHGIQSDSFGTRTTEVLYASPAPVVVRSIPQPTIYKTVQSQPSSDFGKSPNQPPLPGYTETVVTETTKTYPIGYAPRSFNAY